MHLKLTDPSAILYNDKQALKHIKHIFFPDPSVTGPMVRPRAVNLIDRLGNPGPTGRPCSLLAGSEASLEVKFKFVKLE